VNAPSWLGRGLVVRPGQPGPAGAERIVVDRSWSGATVEALDRAWRTRRPVTVELHLEPAELKERERWQGEVYGLTPEFEFARERLHFLIWANNYDGTRDEPPIWWHGRLAQKLGASPSSTQDVLVNGEPVWCDGGPRGGLSVAVLHRESIESQSLRLTQPLPRTGLSLAPDQLQAVLHPAGGARIIAPAGSGKTRVLTERLRHLLVDRGYEPARVMALAYNRRAAREMVERTRDFKPHVQTLHALGHTLLGRPRVLQEREVRGILNRLLTLPKVLGQDLLAPYLEALAEVRLSLRSPGEVEKKRGDVEGLARLFPRYRERLRQENAVDHDEQIYGALELLLADPEARRDAQRRCTHLLIDEFQDLTPAYLLLVRLLAGPSAQVFGVGDDDQVIYGYAGATPRYLIDFGRYFPGSVSYALEVNYRCPDGVVAAAGHLLTRNQARISKSIRPGPEAPRGKPEVLSVPAADWAGQAVRLLQGWLQECAAADVVVLSRTQACLLPLQVYLAEAGIPYHSLVDENVLQRTGLRTALAWLRLAGQPRLNSQDLLEALRRPSRKLKREVVEKAARCRSLNDLLACAEQQEPWPAEQLEEFVRDLRLVGRALARGLPAALQALREKVGLGTALEELDRVAADSHLDDLVALEQTAALHPEPATFEAWLRATLQREGGEGVRLSTVHRVKGMEWDRVLIYGAQKGLWPHRLADDAEEERRIFHVALTRARRQVAVLADDAQPSPYLRQMRPRKAALTAEQLSQAASILTGRERDVLVAHRIQGESLASIAARLGKSENIVQTWLKLAERRLAEI